MDRNAKPDQGAQQEGKNRAGKDCNAELAEAKLRMGQQQLCKEGREIEHRDDHAEGIMRLDSQPAPDDDQDRHQGRIGKDADMLEQAGADQQLIDCKHRHRSHQDRRSDRRQGQHHGQQQDQADNADNDTGFHRSSFSFSVLFGWVSIVYTRALFINRSGVLELKS